MTTTRLRSALWLPLFDDLADPVVVARLAAEAEEGPSPLILDAVSFRFMPLPRA